MKIEANFIGKNYPVYFIADIAANHDGDLNRAKDLIYLAAESGAHAAKFQHFQAESIVSDFGFKNLGQQKSHQSKWKKSVFEVYKDASLNLEWTEVLRDTCVSAGITFFTSPYSLQLVDYVDPYVSAYKIGSGDITWDEIIQHICTKGKPVLLATGASTIDDVIVAEKIIRESGNEYCIMQCNTNYTGSIDNFKYIQLSVLKTYAEMFPDAVLGLSDHTPGCVTVLGAVALGARVIEKHFTDDCQRVGPDHGFSMDPRSWKEMVERTRELECALGDGVKKVEENELETVVLQRTAVRVSCNISQGEILKKEDLVCLRPCPSEAIYPTDMAKIIGKTALKDIPFGSHLTLSDIK